jgi:hypothetical protein
MAIVVIILSILARVAAHSSPSGQTHPTHSPLFRPLLFGIAPVALPFHHAYLEYPHAASATEHVLTRVVRRHSTPNNESSSSFGGRGSAAYLSLIFTVQCRSTEGEDEELCPGQISYPVDPYLWTRRSVWLYNSVPPSHIQSHLGWSSNPISPAASRKR